MGNASHENGTRPAHQFIVFGSAVGLPPLPRQEGHPHCPDLCPVSGLFVRWLNLHPDCAIVTCTLEYRIAIHPRIGAKEAHAETSWVLTGGISCKGTAASGLLRELSSFLLSGLKQSRCHIIYPDEQESKLFELSAEQSA
jgi:hypothetical protein